MVERGKAQPKPGVPNAGRGGNRIVEEDPATGNNANQGKCLGTKPGALHTGKSVGMLTRITNLAHRFALTGIAKSHPSRMEGLWPKRQDVLVKLYV